MKFVTIYRSSGQYRDQHGKALDVIQASGSDVVSSSHPVEEGESLESYLANNNYVELS